MELLIRSQTPPNRCEICHQTDCFDAVTNSCSRCQGIKAQVPHQEIITSNIRPITLRPRTMLLSFFGGAAISSGMVLLLGLVAGSVFNPIIFFLLIMCLFYGGALGIGAKAIYEDLKQRIYWWRHNQNQNQTNK